ncbi:MAG: beta-aspartyl-peptidase (threonine type) IaaA [Oceanicaulis sp. HLUCCA04]|nr:MAG: beta-aspartyl-peptidase (threonine type) IaaA [Oceanicaulis sp. HLUCCA04]
MTRIALAFVALMLATPFAHAGLQQAGENDWSIIIHGGAGVIERGDMDAQTEAAYRAALQSALEQGGAMLRDGADGIDVVEALIQAFEDDPMFNAGRGGVFTADGRVEMDASVMIGSTRAAGAVAGVTSVRHPISLARAVMEHSPHVMLAGDGAEGFAAERGLELADQAFFFTERRWQAMESQVQRMGLPVPPRPEGAPDPEPVNEGALDMMEREHRFGTVGVVVRDQSGVTVAGTSTGGTTAKRWGRVGDTPVIGAGTWADERCGLSATGTGEYFIRFNVAASICREAEYRALQTGPEGAAQAAADAMMDTLLADGGDGGIVMLYLGEPVWAMNTPGMYRASWGEGREPYIAIYDDE